MKNNSTQWIRSGGGPLVCIEAYLADQWCGVTGGKSTHDAGHSYLNDYARACDVDDYLGIIPLRKGTALVLGDMPLETRVWHQQNANPTIVRVFYADQDTDVVEKLRQSADLEKIEPVESLECRISAENLLIFDAARTFTDGGTDFLTLNLQPGDYSIVSKLVKPDVRTSLLIHEFRRREDAVHAPH